MDNDSHGDANEQNAPPAAGRDAPGTPSDQPQEPVKDERGPYKQKRDYSRVRVFGFPLLEFLQVFFNGLLVIAGIVGAVVILRQLDIMEEQMADAQQSGIEQQRATNRALRIAEDQAKALRDLVPATTSAAAAAKLSAEGTIKIAAENTRQVAIADKQAEALNSQAASNKTIADATKRSSEASSQLATTAAATAESQKRTTALEYGAVVRFGALIVLQHGMLTGRLSTNEKTEFRFTATNTGRTPAKDVRIQTIAIGQIGVVYTAAVDSGSKSISAGDAVVLVASAGPFDGPRYSDIEGSIAVTLTYKNIFGDSHTTRGCYYSGVNRTSLNSEFHTCEGHNTSIDAAPEQK